MMKSLAQRGSWAFAQGLDDGMCHISMNGTGVVFNVQIPIASVPDVINNLVRVMEQETHRLIREVNAARDAVSVPA